MTRPTPRVVPVLDLLAGNVVRAVAGRRHEYQPVVSRLCADARPATVADALVRTFGFGHSYVADLDAIAGREPAWADYRTILDRGLRLWLDAGIHTVERARQLAAFEPQGIERLIVGLESIADLDTLRRVLDVIGAERAVFSLDLHDGRPRTNSPAWKDFNAESIADQVLNAGFERLIVLDLAGVGVGQGIASLSLCRQLRASWPDIELITGGGVRGRDDLAAIADAGCDVALVASALHDGRLTLQDVTSP